MARMSAGTLADAVAAVPPGRWAVGVSGGADSVALLLLLRDRSDLQLHVVHLDHETRAGASAEDAAFVEALCLRLGVPSTIATRSTVEADLPRLEPNLSARYRAARLALFRRVVRSHNSAGVLLAHHADDDAETILHRLLRGSGPGGLTGMRGEMRLGVGDDDLLVKRPLLGVRREALRDVLRQRGEAWREDVTNESHAFARNRLRRLLASRPALADALVAIGRACEAYEDWLIRHTAWPPQELPVRDVLAVPAPMRRVMARIWLARAGVPQDRIDAATIAQLIEMAQDASSAPRQHFPGSTLVRRRRGVLTAERGA